MGKFNILSGGYYGRLGQTVGQRWRNKRIVRTYVIPRDPKTEKQEANRYNFGDCTAAVQLALSMNGSSSLWNSLTNTAFNNRMEAARAFQKAGGFYYSFVPLIPYGYQPAYAFSSSPALVDGVITWTCTTTDDIAGREMVVALRLRNETTLSYSDFVSHTIIAGSGGVFTISVQIPDGYELSDDSACIGISTDDTNVDADIIYMPPTSLANLREQINLTLSALSVTYDSATNTYSGTITTVPTVDTDATPALMASLSGILQAETAQQNTIIQTVTSGGALSFTFTPITDALSQRVLFPSGSVCSIPATTFQSEHKNYIVQDTSLSFSATLETQTYSTELSYEWASPNLVIKASIPESATVTAAGAARVYGLMFVDDFESGFDSVNADTIAKSGAYLQMQFNNIVFAAIVGGAGYSDVLFTTAPTFTAAGVTYRLCNSGDWLQCAQINVGAADNAIFNAEQDTGAEAYAYVASNSSAASFSTEMTVPSVSGATVKAFSGGSYTYTLSQAAGDIEFSRYRNTAQNRHELLVSIQNDNYMDFFDGIEGFYCIGVNITLKIAGTITSGSHAFSNSFTFANFGGKY